MESDSISKLEKIMYIQDLTIEAKAIYAYLCSFQKDARNPTIQDMMYDLNISKGRLFKHMGFLVEKGLVKKKRLKEKGLYAGILYILT